MNADDARLLFRKLRDEKVDVLCSGRLFGVSFLIRGKVCKVDAEQVHIESVSGYAAIVISLVADNLMFGYSEVRSYPELVKTLPEEAQTAMALLIGFPDRGLMPFPERVIVVEVFPVPS